MLDPTGAAAATRNLRHKHPLLPLCVTTVRACRSADLEEKDGVSLPSYRGDIINGPEFTKDARIPDPW